MSLGTSLKKSLLFLTFASLSVAAIILIACQRWSSQRSFVHSNLSIFIDWYGFGNYSGVPDSFALSFFVINNSDDTLRYTSTENLFSKFYCADNDNMIVIDEGLPKDSIQRVIIPPHRGKARWINFKFQRRPDTNFKFKLGMKFVPFYQGSAQNILNRMTHENYDTIWSDMTLVKTNRYHTIPARTEEENKEYAQRKPLTAFFPALAANDRSKYSLSIDQTKIGPAKDTLIWEPDFQLKKLLKRKYSYAICQAKLKNNSTDTLKYVSMSCSWLDTYKTSDTAFRIPVQLCFKNVYEIRVVPPRGSSIIKIPVMTDNKNNLPRKIRIGFSLQKYLDYDQIYPFFDLKELMGKPGTSNLIWSNEITIH